MIPVDEISAGPVDDGWLRANEAVNALGFDWLDRRLAGEPGGEVRAAWHAAREALAATGTPCALDTIATLFDLAPFDEDILLVALAAAHDGSFGPRFGAAQGRAVASPATPHLLALLLFGSHRLPIAALQRLTSSAPLRRFALIEAELADLAVTATLTLPVRIYEALCGFGVRDAALGEVLRQQDPVALPPRLEALATRLVATAAEPLRLLIVGPRGSGRAALATTVLARLRMGALVASAALPPGSAVITARDATLENCGVVVDLDTSGAATARILDAMPLPLILLAEAAEATLPHIPIARLVPMNPAERAGLWRRVPGITAPAAAAAAEQFALGPAAIGGIARQPGLAERGLWAACRDLGAPGLEALTTRITPQRSWDDIVLADATRADLAALIAQVRQRPLVQGEWGFRDVLGRATGVSALFAGPSGTGKTMAAEVVAQVLALDLHLVDLSQVTSKFIGETQKNLRHIFDAAEGGGAVLFFDEADALFGKRSEVKDSHDRYANAEVSYLLQRMETYGGLAILATNLKSNLDTAFLRRLRVIVDFALPDVAARRALWQRALPATAPQHDIDWAQLCRLELSGGNITTIAANAAGRAAMAGEPIGMAHLRATVAAEFRKLDRDASGLG